MRSGDPPILIERCETVDASAEVTLLRLRYRVHDGGVGGPTLVIGSGPHARRFSPLPAPPGDDDLLRAAFAIDFGSLSARAPLSLELESGRRVLLPVPAAGTRRDGTGPAGAPVEGERRLPDYEQLQRQSERLSLLESELARLRQRRESSRERLTRESHARLAAEEELATLRRRLIEAEQSRDAGRRELELRCRELERSLEDALTELRAVTRAEHEASRELHALKGRDAGRSAVVDLTSASSGSQ